MGIIRLRNGAGRRKRSHHRGKVRHPHALLGHESLRLAEEDRGRAILAAQSPLPKIHVAPGEDVIRLSVDDIAAGALGRKYGEAVVRKVKEAKGGGGEVEDWSWSFSSLFSHVGGKVGGFVGGVVEYVGDWCGVGRKRTSPSDGERVGSGEEVEEGVKYRRTLDSLRKRVSALEAALVQERERTLLKPRVSPLLRRLKTLESRVQKQKENPFLPKKPTSSSSSTTTTTTTTAPSTTVATVEPKTSPSPPVAPPTSSSSSSSTSSSSPPVPSLPRDLLAEIRSKKMEKKRGGGGGGDGGEDTRAALFAAIRAKKAVLKPTTKPTSSLPTASHPSRKDFLAAIRERASAMRKKGMAGARKVGKGVEKEKTKARPHPPAPSGLISSEALRAAAKKLKPIVVEEGEGEGEVFGGGRRLGRPLRPASIMAMAAATVSAARHHPAPPPDMLSPWSVDASRLHPSKHASTTPKKPSTPKSGKRTRLPTPSRGPSTPFRPDDVLGVRLRAVPGVHRSPGGTPHKQGAAKHKRPNFLRDALAKRFDHVRKDSPSDADSVSTNGSTFLSSPGL